MPAQSIDSTLQIRHIILLILLTLAMVLPGLSALPVIDRDEARYAQATVQMVETGDYINIRFQDRARNKKPAGIYWMQAGSVKAFSEPGERKIWAHRLPSVFGAVLAVLSTYWAGLILLGRRGAFIAGAILATSALLVFEAHIAKTDAMLCGLSALALAAMIRLRDAPNNLTAIIFWIAMGGAVMIKGPITPALVMLTLVTLAVWERDFVWMRRLVSPAGIAAALLIILPWSYLIWQATDGAFFRDAIGGDLAPKIAGGQEKHGALPGYYLLTLPILFWPGTLVLLSGLALGWQRARTNSDGENGNLYRLLLAWAVPFWILLELVPTKLPNYLLPTYPALALLGASAVILSKDFVQANWPKYIGLALFVLIGLALCTAIILVQYTYIGPSIGMFVVAAICAALILDITRRWKNPLQSRTAVIMLPVIWIMTTTIYQFLLPGAKTLQVSHQIEQSLKNAKIILPRHGGGHIFSPQFTEPSLVYRLGTDIVLGDKIKGALDGKAGFGDVILIDRLAHDYATWHSQLTEIYADHGLCLSEFKTVEGINYSKGDDVQIALLRAQNCQGL